MTEKLLIESSFRIKEIPLLTQLWGRHFLFIGLLSNFEVLLILFLITSTYISCCCKKKKKKNLSPESKPDANVVLSNPPTENEDFIPGANDFTASSQPEGNQTKDSKCPGAPSRIEKSQTKTAKAMPKNVWELAYPSTTENNTVTKDETKGAGKDGPTGSGRDNKSVTKE